jgi:hypothetical protein
MPEPTSTAAAGTLTLGAAVMPLLTVAGVSLGLRADVLLAGFSGSIAAMALLNTVPSSGDTWRELWNTSLRRIGVAIGSALFAGYAAPLLALINGVPQALLVSVAFVAGAGAQQLLARMVKAAKTGPDAAQEGQP